MENKISFYSRLIFILILSASCLQKQDALILNKADLPPIVQFRLTIVPNYTPMIHSIRHKRANYEYGDITYTLSWENGSETVVHPKDFETELYIPFLNTTIQEGRKYKLVGKMKDDEFEEEIYIPEKPTQMQFDQIEPYLTRDKHAKFKAKVNAENSDLFIMTPIRWDSTTGAMSIVNGGGTQFNTKIIAISKGNKSVSFEQNVSGFFRVFKDGQVGSNPFYKFEHTVDSKNCIPSIYCFLICDNKSGSILTNRPEHWTTEKVPPFSNIPPYPLNVDHKIFKGYFIGYQLFSPPLTVFQDKSGVVTKINFFDKNLNKIEEQFPDFVGCSFIWRFT